MNCKHVFRQLCGASLVWVSVLAMGALLCASCRRKVDEHEAVRAATQHYFGLLLSGDTKAVATHDSIIDSLAYVFLDVTFADSTTERMRVRMVRKGKEWKMM